MRPPETFGEKDIDVDMDMDMEDAVEESEFMAKTSKNVAELKEGEDPVASDDDDNKQEAVNMGKGGIQSGRQHGRYQRRAWEDELDMYRQNMLMMAGISGVNTVGDERNPRKGSMGVLEEDDIEEF
jgi:hypothetical protein